MSFLFFVVAIILLIWIVRLSGRVDQLERRIFSGGPVPGIPVAPATPPPPPVTSLAGTASPIPMPQMQPKSDFDFAGWLTKVGALALILGVGFFLKYAIDQGWIGIAGRVVIGLLIGAFLVILSELWRDKYKMYAQALGGGGLAILYFTVFAASQFYALVPSMVGAGLALAVSALAVFLAHKRASLVFAALAVIGGYLSPIMFEVNQASAMTALIFLTVLNLAVITTLLKKYWLGLVFLAFAGSAINYIIWAVENTGAFAVMPALTFLLISAAIFMLFATAFYRQEADNAAADSGDAAAGAYYALVGFFHLIAVYEALSPGQEGYLLPAGLVIAALSFLAYALFNNPKLKIASFALSLVGSASVFAALAWQFEGKILDLFILALALVLALLGFLFRRQELRLWGLAALVLALLMVLFEDRAGTSLFLFNSKFGLIALIIVIFGIMEWLYRNQPTPDFEKEMPAAVRIAWAGLIWYGISSEIGEYFSSSVNVRNLLLSFWWLAYATLLLIYGSIKLDLILRRTGLVLLAFTVLKVFLYDIQTLDTVYKTIAFVVLGVILLTMAFTYQKNKEKIKHFWQGN